ncbi:MAG TPA: serine/threonine-protein kinase, partial [Kofleriaceae bacterium]
MGLRAAEEFGPYLVYEQLGIGGMATVHRAETTGIAGFRRPVALKRMLPHVAANDDLVRSFVREARLASHLRHANVAQTYDLGKVGDIYFIAMELVLGRTLRDILRLCSKTGERIPIPIALNILNQVCDALDYAHNLTDDSGQDLGIIHRDVSPSNVIVAEGGVVKLIDFGIAKASAAGMQTMSGTIKGKFGYMAPEYLAGKIDARADLFALGVIAHELLTGRPLFQGRDDMDTLFRVKQMTIESPRKWNPEIPEEIDSIVMTALDRDPDARWQRAAAMRVALTTETKHLGLAILDNQVIGWVDRIFEEALGDVGTPAPTRVLGTSPSISASSTAEDSVVIERIEGERAETSPGEGNARDDADELLRTRLREPARQSDPPFGGLAATNQPQRTLLGSLPIAPQAMRMPLPPPPLSVERTNVPMRAFPPEPEPVVAPTPHAVKPEP